MIEAKIICDSVSPDAIRLTTFKLRYPKFIHGEFMTHRLFSRNASSSRAVPVKKMIEEARIDAMRASPVSWGVNSPGMQARQDLVGDEEQVAKELWAMAALRACEIASEMDRIGVHKQIVNRILEPFTHINVVATATQWDNFFGLRLHKDAQPEMRALATCMWEARKASTPRLIRPGEWHLPFVASENTFNSRISDILPVKIRSVASCARVSYESFETGKLSTLSEDSVLFNKLTNGGHWSPFEHQATPDEFLRDGVWKNLSLHGNLVGWCQYRKMMSAGLAT